MLAHAGRRVISLYKTPRDASRQAQRCGGFCKSLKHITRMAFLLIFCFLTFCPANSGLGQEAGVFRAYHPANTPTEGTMDAIRQLLGENGRIIDDRETGKLLILAPSNMHAQVAAILEQADVPARNIRIDLNIRGNTSAKDTEVNLNPSGRIRVTQNGTTMRFKMSPTLRSESLGGGSSEKQSLVVVDGGDASLMIGEEVPYFEWLQEMGMSWGYIPRDQIMKNVGANLHINPTIMADGRTILLRITPELSGMTGGKTKRVKYTKASTTLRIRNGSTVSLAGLTKDSEFYRKFLVGFSRNGEKESLNMSVTATILDPAGREMAR